MNKQQEIEELLSMFHDFVIKSLSKYGETLTLELTIPWGQMWNPAVLEYQIRVELMGCRNLLCEYFTLKVDEDNKRKPLALRETERFRTSDLQTIENLGLEIQSYTYTQPDVYILHCNSSQAIAGGDLTFTALDYCIFDSDGRSLAINQMKQWAHDWWNGIQEMWKEHKN